MSARTGISWTDRTWNPVVGCTKVSQGCKHCYAKTLHDARHKAFKDGKLQNIPQYAEPFETVQTIPERLAEPLSWRKPQRVFVNSMSDLFHEDIPDAFIAGVFAVMFLAERHTFQVLTKRPARMRALLSSDAFRDAILDAAEPLWERTAWANDEARSYEDWCGWVNGDGLDGAMPDNIWLGVSVENQAAADERIPLLLQTPAAVRFLSCEPLLGPVDLDEFIGHGCDGGPPRADCEACAPQLHWVIAGGESGKGARPPHPDWIRSLCDQTTAAGVAFHFKQWGEYRPVVEIYEDDTSERLDECDDDRVVCVAPNGVEWVNNEHRTDGQPPADSWYMERVGTKRAGRELDGRAWDEFPGRQA